MSPGRILLTGASGFIGAAVAHRLVDAGRPVALLLRPESNTWRIADILDSPVVTVIRGDLGSLDSVSDAVARFSPDAVAHLAWNGVVGAQRNESHQTDNVFTSLALYRLAQRLGVRKFVGLGSQAEYGPCANRVNELTRTAPTTLYGASKLATYLMLDRMASLDGVSFSWLRLFSSYGPKDDPSWLVPYVALTLLAGKEPALTRAEQRWDYIFVEDVASAVTAALDSSAAGVFNLGSGEARPLRDIICQVRDLVDPALSLGFGKVDYRPDQVMFLEADITELSTRTGWRPVVPLESGLKLTIDWYRNSHGGKNEVHGALPPLRQSGG